MSPAPRVRIMASRQLTVATALGVALLAATAAVAPERAWANCLLAGVYLVTLGLGGAFFVAITTVCGAGWSTAFRRVPEAMTGLLVAGVLVWLALAGSPPRLELAHHGAEDPGTFWFKAIWLRPAFFAARSVAYVLVWIFLAHELVRRSRRQDERPPAAAAINVGTSILFLFVFAVTITLAGVDWIMALEPLWFSTMWGVYQFSGLTTATLAFIIIACVALRRLGPLDGLFREEHLHDLSKLLFGFSCFWMYIWFSQYMLIWYSNIPEETSYFIARVRGSWGPVVVGSIVLNWGAPFFVLLPRPCKRSESVMLKVAVAVLIGRWVDLYVMIFPPLTGATPVFGLPEAATMVVIGCLATLLFSRVLAQAGAAPANDPHLQESLTYHS